MIARRPVLAGLALGILGAAAAEGKAMEESELYGMIGKITAVPGKRDALIALLTEGTSDMPGCLAYIVAEDRANPDAIWVTDIWKTPQYHADSLKLPAVQAAIAKGRPLIAGFETSAETRPVGGHGLEG
jgi:quinol monooxygenase YgiN